MTRWVPIDLHRSFAGQRLVAHLSLAETHPAASETIRDAELVARCVE